jgi:hypothetical protein
MATSLHFAMKRWATSIFACVRRFHEQAKLQECNQYKEKITTNNYFTA